MDTELLRTIIHLCCFAEVGVVARMYLGKLFGGSCQYPAFTGPWAWVPCVTSPGLSRPGGALFQDMPANVIGSWIIGFLASSEVLAANFKPLPGPPCALAFLPPASPLQRHSALHLGLRTGLCGSLTTYASWTLQMVQMFVGGEPSALGSEWVAALWGLVVNVTMSMAALVCGQQVAMLAHAYCASAAAAAVCDAPPPPPAGKGAAAAAELELPDVALTLDKAAGEGARAPELAPAQAAQVQAPPLPLPPPPAVSSVLCLGVDACALIVLMFLTGISIAYAVTEGYGTVEEQDSYLGIRYIWFAILLGPVGCLLRWRLSKLNGQYGWFPWGTWSANMIACVIDFSLQSVLVRVTSLSAVQESILSGITAGISGCLSTVSTWVTEIQALNRQIPGNINGYIYTLASICSGVSLGLIIYGTSVWTM